MVNSSFHEFIISGWGQVFCFYSVSPGTWRWADPQRPMSTDPHTQHLDVAHRETSVESPAGCTPPCAGLLSEKCAQEPTCIWALSGLTSGGFIFDGLLEECDVPEGAEEENHLVVFVPNGGDLHVKPYGRSCRWQNSLLIQHVWVNTKKPGGGGVDTHCPWCRAAPRRTVTRGY